MTFVVLSWTWAKSVLRHFSPIQMKASRAKRTIVWFQSPEGVLSFLTDSPGARPETGALADMLRFSVVVRVPAASSVTVSAASATGLSTVVSFCTSDVQSAFFVTLRLTVVPLETDACLPVPATFCCFTPKCASSFCSSKIVFAVEYSGMSCWTRVRCSRTQL